MPNSSLFCPDDLERSLQDYSESRLISLLRTVELRLGTAEERANDVALAQALGHRIMNVRMIHQFSQLGL